MLKNKLYLDIKLTANRFHWIANYSISSTDSKLEPPYKIPSITLRLKGWKTTGDCKGTIHKMRLIVASLNSGLWCLILKVRCSHLYTTIIFPQNVTPCLPSDPIEMKSLLITESALVCKNDHDKIDKIQVTFCNRLATLSRLCFANWF